MDGTIGRSRDGLYDPAPRRVHLTGDVLRPAADSRSLGGVNCPACGRAMALAAGERVGFRDTCEGCGADLHACRNCAHYDPGAYNACREPRAERVLDKERANRCDDFAPRAGEGGGAAAEAARALSEAERLFRK